MGRSVLIGHLKSSRYGSKLGSLAAIGSGGRMIKLGFLLTLAFLALIGAASFVTVNKLHREAREMERAADFVTQVGTIQTLATDAETAQRGFVVTGDEAFLQPLLEANEKVGRELLELRGMTLDNSRERQQAESLSELVSRRLQRDQAVVDLRKKEGFEVARREVAEGRGNEMQRRIRELVDEIKRSQLELRKSRRAQAEQTVTTAQTVILAGSLVALAAVAMAILIIQGEYAGRRQASTVLRHQAHLIDESHDAVIISEWNGPILFWNRGAELLYGYSKEEALGQRPLDLLRAGSSRAAEDVCRELKAASFWEGTFRHITKSGEQLSVETRMVLTEEEGNAYILQSNRDITKRLAAEEALIAANEQLEERVHARTSEIEAAHQLIQESENRLRTVTDTARVGLVIVTEAHRYRYANRAYCEILGIQNDNLVGQRVADVLPDAYPAQIGPRLERAFSGERVTYELCLPPAEGDGADRYFDVSYEPGEDHSGKIVVVVISDVTQVKRAEAKLRELLQENSDLKTALNQHAIVAITDAQGRIMEVNDKFCEISKYSREELIGKDHRIINSGTHPKEFFRDLWGTISQGRVWHGDIKNKAEDGSYYWVATTIVPFLGEDGKPRQYVAIRADITARKEAEAALRESLRENTDLRAALDEHAIVAITDPQGRITEVNDKFCEISKYSREELIGKDHRIINSGTHPKEFFRDLWGTISQGRVWQGDIKNKARDGSYYWVATTIVPFLTRDGKPRQYVAIRADITARKEAEEALRESDERLQSVIENMAEGLILSNLDGQLLHWNRAALEIHGFRDSAQWCRMLPELRTVFELSTLDGEVLEPDEWPMARLYRGETLRGVELRVRRVSGDWERILSYSGDIVPEPGGKQIAFLTIADITRQKEASVALKASEERLRLITNLVPHGIFAKDSKGRYIFANRALAEDCGRLVEEILGSDDFALVADPAQAKAYQEDDRAVIESGKPKFIAEELNTNLLGQTRVLQTTKMPFTVPETGERAVLGVSVDITERKAAEDALRRSESTLAETERLSGIGSFDWDVPGNVSAWSSNMCRLLDIDPVRKGPGMREFFQQNVVLPDDRAHLDKSLQDALDGTKPLDVEYRITRRDGRIRHIHARGNVIRDQSGRPVSVLGWIQDVTERKIAEAALRESEIFNREVLDSLTAHIAVLDRDGNVLIVNDAWRRFVAENGRQIVEGGIGDNYLTSCEHAVRENNDKTATAALEGIREVINGSRSYFGLEYPCHSPEQQRWFQMHVCPLTTRSNAVVIAHEEITERRLAEVEIRQLNTDLEKRVAARTSELETANKELEAFSYSVSHDLRSPLRAIDGFSQALIEDYGSHLPAEAQDYLLIIRQGAQRMGTLIDDLLSFSRLSRSALSRRVVNMEELVNAVLKDLKPHEGDRNVKIVCGDLSDCWGDPALIKQVWVNLISNALKYSRQRPLAIIQIGTEMKNGATVYFVRDNGSGFDMRYSAKLFGVFQRLHRTEEFEGTGVGLAIVQRVVHRHGGRVWADAIVDQGATFYFTIPNTEHS